MTGMPPRMAFVVGYRPLSLPIQQNLLSSGLLGFCLTTFSVGHREPEWGKRGGEVQLSAHISISRVLRVNGSLASPTLRKRGLFHPNLLTPLLRS